MAQVYLDEYDLWLLEAAAEGHHSVEELSDRGNVPKSTAYRRVPALARKGFLTAQKRDNGVGRPALIYTLTDEGVDELRRFSEKLRSTIKRLDEIVGQASPPQLSTAPLTAQR